MSTTNPTAPRRTSSGRANGARDDLVQRRDRRRIPRAIFRVPFGETPGDRIHLGLNGALRDAGLRARDDGERADLAKPRNAGVRNRRVRDEHVGPVGRESEIGREHAEDFIRRVAERQRLPDGGWRAAKLAQPEAMREQHDAVTSAANHFVLLRQAAVHHGRAQGP